VLAHESGQNRLHEAVTFCYIGDDLRALAAGNSRSSPWRYPNLFGGELIISATDFKVPSANWCI
jgi:hypothetical protein